MEALRAEVEGIARRAKCASMELGLTSGEMRNAALGRMSQALRDSMQEILDANEADVSKARADGVSDALIDRLLLTPERIEDIADALLALKDLPDPLDRVHEERTLPNGLHLKRISVPLGVVGVIYEARPNVTADAAGICIKSGNAVILRGGSMALRTNTVMGDVLALAAVEAGLPEGAIQSITTTDRAATDILMQLRDFVDVIIPRGGAGLITHCVEVSKVPVIETGTGNCHVYVHASADLGKAHDIILNAKCRRLGVCNAAESVLIDESIVDELIPSIVGDLASQGIELHMDDASFDAAQRAADADPRLAETLRADHATEHDWATEYLGPELAIKCVTGVDEAIQHINAYGTKHSESIVATDEAAIDAFLRGVDAAAVYANASTAFTDGGQFGLGAEIGISTQKLHARGPFALEALTSYKYIIVGEGQIRD